MVLTTVTRAVQIGRKIYNLQQKYKYLDPTEKFITKFVPPGYRNYARIAAGVGVGGSILYDVYQLINDGFQTPIVPTADKRDKKRNGNKFSYRSRYKYGPVYNRRYRRRCRPCPKQPGFKRQYY